MESPGFIPFCGIGWVPPNTPKAKEKTLCTLKVEAFEAGLRQGWSATLKDFEVKWERLLLELELHKTVPTGVLCGPPSKGCLLGVEPTACLNVISILALASFLGWSQLDCHSVKKRPGGLPVFPPRPEMYYTNILGWALYFGKNAWIGDGLKDSSSVNIWWMKEWINEGFSAIG